MGHTAHFQQHRNCPQLGNYHLHNSLGVEFYHKRPQFIRCGSQWDSPYIETGHTGHFQQHRYCPQLGNYHLHNPSGVRFYHKSLGVSWSGVKIFKLIFSH
ncbi:hypothetical protein DVH24_015720 [Malus domestica]|uniref:Uncharacterized protein n=1 Tax=Malus domestica TaxID=3750 RepID=A0A498HHV6_MALDO|nr:hypothetical protein DVH24_015720 [Malus domestica]